MDISNASINRGRAPVRLGELLVQSGVLTAAQRDQILKAQATSGRPFGELAEKMFSVHPESVESAWAQQYLAGAPSIDPLAEPTDTEILALVGRRQAWQFRVLPLRRDGAEIMVCTTPQDLVRALKFMGWQVRGACYMVLSEPEPLYAALAKHYPMAGLGPKSLRDGQVRIGARARVGRAASTSRAKRR
jgi:Type II secretion system (T2SS), protein E, N-terminal domain